MTTNGVLLAPHARTLRDAGLHRLTVSLDTLQPDRFQTLARYDELPRVLAGIDAAAPLFPGLKLDSVVIRGVNDDELVDLIEFGRARDAEVRFIEYMDVGGATAWSMDRVVVTGRHAQGARPRTTGRSKRCTKHPRRLPIAIDSRTARSSASSPRRRRRSARAAIAAGSRPTACGILCLYATHGIDLRHPLRHGASAERDRSADPIGVGRAARSRRGEPSRGARSHAADPGRHAEARSAPRNAHERRVRIFRLKPEASG